jgi:hypothetical protein
MTTAHETATTAVQEAGTVASTARDEAVTVASTAADQARTVAQTATDATSQVVGEAARQARDLLAETRDQVRTQAQTQTQRLAENARTVAGQLTTMASATEQGPATEIAHQLADKVQSLAGYIEGRSPEMIVDDLRRYARQRPGMFLLGAGAVGFLAGRLLKGATAPDPGTANAAGTGAWTGADTTFPGTATGAPTAGMELDAGTATVMPGAVPQFSDPYPATGDVATGSGLRTPGIGDGYGNG